MLEIQCTWHTSVNNVHICCRTYAVSWLVADNTRDSPLCHFDCIIV